MRIVIVTNVLVSSVFFGGFPRKILTSVVGQKITACATAEIVNEYEEIVQEMIEPITHVKICRDPDDNKFLGCAKDSQALYIVSGNKDLLVIEEYENIQIMMAKNFYEKYFSDK